MEVHIVKEKVVKKCAICQILLDVVLRYALAQPIPTKMGKHVIESPIKHADGSTYRKGKSGKEMCYMPDSTGRCAPPRARPTNPNQDG